MQKILLMIIGAFFLLLGIIGISVPILPTAPFVIAASWCFARSSPKFHHYLRQHQLFGKVLCDWEDKRIIRRSVKKLASAITLPSFLISAYLLGREHLLLIVIIGSVLIAVFYWIWQQREA